MLLQQDYNPLESPSVRIMISVKFTIVILLIILYTKSNHSAVILKYFYFLNVLINLFENFQRSFDIHWRHTICNILSKPHVNFFNCTLENLPRNRGNYATVKIQFRQDIVKILLDFRVSMPNSDNKDMDLIKFRSDGCRISKYKSSNPIITAMTKQIYQSANFPGDCPLKAVSFPFCMRLVLIMKCNLLFLRM